MMCFKDITFCASPDCKGECGRQWTPELAKQAESWWGGPNAPVAFAYFCKSDDAQEYIEREKNLRTYDGSLK